MKKLILIAVAAAGLAGCGAGGGPRGISFEEQIRKTNACRKAGGRVIELRYQVNNAVGSVECSFEPERDYGKPCRDVGGVPIFSSWDGTLKDCKMPIARALEKPAQRLTPRIAELEAKNARLQEIIDTALPLVKRDINGNLVPSDKPCADCMRCQGCEACVLSKDAALRNNPPCSLCRGCEKCLGCKVYGGKP